jgi:hypothetical protein
MSRWGRWERFETVVFCGYVVAYYVPGTNGKRKAR